MLDPSLHVLDDVPGVAFKPAPIEVLCNRTKLDDQIIGKILRLDLAALLPPQTDQHRLIAAHDHPGVGATDERTALNFVRLSSWSHFTLQCTAPK